MAKTAESVEQELRENPGKHVHLDLRKLTSCCTIKDRLHIDLLDAHDAVKRAQLDCR